MKNVIQAKAKEKQESNLKQNITVSQKSDERYVKNPMRTDEELSKLAGVNLGGYICDRNLIPLIFCSPCGANVFRYSPCRWGKFDLRHRCISVLHSERALAAENSAVRF